VVRTLPPRALAAGVPATEFSAGRAVGTVKAITSTPRLVGSPAFEDARSYLLAQLSAMGLETDIQSTTLDGVRVENVLGRMEGTGSDEAILLSAHLDSVPTSPGATDDGSGVAAVLETVRALRAGTPLRNSVIVLFTGPEEDCCFGARAFASAHPWAKDVRLVVNVDAGGLDGPSILAATGPDAGWLIEQAAHFIPDPIGSSAIEALGSPATDYTQLFRKLGWLGFDFNLSWSKRIHSPLDNPDNLNPASLQHQGEHMLAVARRFGNLSLEFPKIPRQIYFDVLGLTIVYYPTSWAIPILVGVTLVFAIVIALGFRRKRLTLQGSAFGALLLLLSLVSVPLLLALVHGAIIQPLLSAQPTLAGALVGDSPLSNGIRWGAALLPLGTTFIWYTLARKKKKVGREDLAAGVSVVLYVAACGTTLAIPGLSYLLVWPLLAGIIAAVIRFSTRGGETPQAGWLPFIGQVIAAGIAIVLFVPGILIAVLSIDIRSIYFVPIFVVTLLGFLIPAWGTIF
jgi:hypothetical protein